MDDYLKGYLEVIPDAERLKLKNLLQNSSNTMKDIVSEDEFAEIIRRIAQKNEQQAEFIEQNERLDHTLYNEFFRRVQIDLQVLFTESDLIERALVNYDRLYDGILADLQKEIDKLKEKVNNLRLVAEGEDGLIVRSVDFRTNTMIENDRETLSYLFTDRDGSIIPSAEVVHSGEVHYVTLKKDTSVDRVHDREGNTTASFTILDRRGIPSEKDGYPISDAIDNSAMTYWADVVLVDEPITVGMDNFAPGGAMVKFEVILQRPEIVSEISLLPFTTYPLEIVSVMYQADTETYHVPEELIKKKVESTETMVIQFPRIIAKRFVFTLRQKNYTRNSYMVREQEMHKADLWDKIKKREVQVTLSDPSAANQTVSQTDLNSWSGWDIYQKELEKYNQAYQEYLVALSKYRAQWG